VTPPRILLTGAPGAGKTTLVRKVVAALSGMPMAGFYTEEIRGQTGRTGFRAVALDGRTARLATVGNDPGPRVGRYGVHVPEFEAVALPQLGLASEISLLVIDEIGKMECLSAAFVAAARGALAAAVPLLGTVALKGGGFIAEAKSAPGVSIITITLENRDQLAFEIAARFRRG